MIKILFFVFVLGTYFMDKAHPLLSGATKTGFEVRRGRNVNLQPKLRAESLRNETVTIGLEKIKDRDRQ